jgi:hypothetical protein
MMRSRIKKRGLSSGVVGGVWVDRIVACLIDMLLVSGNISRKRRATTQTRPSKNVLRDQLTQSQSHQDGDIFLCGVEDSIYVTQHPTSNVRPNPAFLKRDYEISWAIVVPTPPPTVPVLAGRVRTMTKRLTSIIRALCACLKDFHYLGSLPGLSPTASTTRSTSLLEEPHIAPWPWATTVRPAATWSPPPFFPL